MAKRMVLVDEELLDYHPMLRTKQDLSWKRPTEQVVKSEISNLMKSTLDDPTIPEDVKVKDYGQNLNRFLQAKRKLVEPEETKEPETIVPEEPPKKPKKRKQKKETSQIVAARISLRTKQRKPKKFMWDEW